MNGPRILIVDDHQLAREGLAAVLSQAGMDLVGLAATGEEAVELARELNPALVLMDVRLGNGIDGLEATRRIVALNQSIRILMLTLHDTPAYLREALSAGASGYVLKDTGIADLKTSIHRVLEGTGAIPLHLLTEALKTQETSEKIPDVTSVLTPREIEVLGQVAEGLTNKEIARKLDISPATVKAHVERIIGKLGVSDRTQAAVLSVKMKSSMVDER
ncbi:response regulator [Qipengyuania qiaonensis]|uniref:Response regulator transcription factor n=1 Tax=Qipengyuania qiaonensis TaxID=2867240 RepID=A0ABS7JA03_9SPHN|nr:response regulator transcription factor [Qipengyuania qiaonensis]MBX7484086.1 response regulator transcription factor [Qipengyuania qiaonensis]